MPAPSPSLIVSDPAPLNPTDFPFAVLEFPAQELRDTVGLFRVPAGRDTATPSNPERIE